MFTNFAFLAVIRHMFEPELPHSLNISLLNLTAYQLGGMWDTLPSHWCASLTSERGLRRENAKIYFTYCSPQNSKQNKLVLVWVFCDSLIKSKTEMLPREIVYHQNHCTTWSYFVFLVSNTTDSRQNLGSSKYIVLQLQVRAILLNEVCLLIYAILSINVLEHLQKFGCNCMGISVHTAVPFEANVPVAWFTAHCFDS